MAQAILSPPRITATGVPNGRMAIWWFFASEITIFGGLMACYLLYRMHHPEWSQQAEHLVRLAGAYNTVLLLTSSLTIVLAQAAAEAGNLRRAANLMDATYLLGLNFLWVKAVEYHHEFAAGITPLKDLFWSFYFLMTGLHAVHLMVGIVAIWLIARGIRQGRHPARVGIVSMYWHFVDVVWAFLFPILYLIS